MPTLYDNFSQVKQYIDQEKPDLTSYVTKTELAGMSYVTSNTLNSYLTVPPSIVPNPTVPYTLYRYGLSSNDQWHFIYPNAISYTNAVSTDGNTWASVGTVRNYVDGRITEIEASYVTSTALDGMSYATTSQLPVIDEDIIPKSDGSYQIGSESYMYGALYANKVYLGDGTYDAAHLFPTYAYVADYVAEHGGGVIDENIIPKETNTYTLGDSSYLYAATYTDAVYVNTNNKIYNTAGGGMKVQRGGTDICAFLGGANLGISPVTNNTGRLGNADQIWSNVFSYNINLSTNSKLYYKTQYQVNLQLNGSDKFVFRTNHFSPASNGSIDLGQNDLYWNNFYAYNAYISNYNNLIWTGTAAEYELLPDYTTYQFYLVTAE